MARRRKRTPSAWRVERQLIGYVYEFPDITRSDLAKRLGQSPAAISLVIRRLINNGWLRESGRAASLGGRRPVQLRLSSEHAYIVGLDVSPNTIRAVLMDADGSAVNQITEQVKPNVSRAETIKRIVAAANSVTAKTNAKGDRLLGVGLAISGVVYSDTGLARATPGLFNWESVDLVSELSSAFNDKLVAVDSSARTRLNYEVYNNSALRNQTVLMVDLGFNVGGSLMVNGQAYQGAEGASFDLAHILVPTSSGETAILEDVASEPAILNQIKGAFAEGYPSLLRDSVKDPEKITIQQIIRAAQAGDQLSYIAISNAAEAIGHAVTLLANILRPKTVLFAGELAESGVILLDQVKRLVRLNVLPDVYENLRIASSEADEYAAALGAAHLVLRRWITELAPNTDGALQAA